MDTKTRAPLRLRRVWTQEVAGGYVVKGLSIGGKVVYLQRMFKGMYDFALEPNRATVYCEKKADSHAWTIETAIKKGRPITGLLTDNRIRPDLLFVMLVNGGVFGGVFDRAEKAKEATAAYNREHGDGSATYIDVTNKINQFVQVTQI